MNIFGNRSNDVNAHLDWTNERPRSNLACSLLELIRVCVKDLRAPDFKEDSYNTVEILMNPLLENIDSPSMILY